MRVFKRILFANNSGEEMQIIIKNHWTMAHGDNDTLDAKVYKLNGTDAIGNPNWSEIKHFFAFNDIPAERSRLCSYVGAMADAGYERKGVMEF